MNIYKKIIFTILFLSSGAQAENVISAGLGAQYGGAMGIQYGYLVESHQLRGATGLFGVTVGYDYLINDLSLGLTYGNMFGSRDSSFLSVNYYFSDKYQYGWRLGLDVGIRAEYNDKRNSDAFFTLGYSFFSW